LQILYLKISHVVEQLSAYPTMALQLLPIELVLAHQKGILQSTFYFETAEYTFKEIQITQIYVERKKL